MKSNNKNNIMLTTLEDAEIEFARKAEIPPGYIEVALSTKGKVGAPAIVHVRNFKVNEILALSMTSERDVPERLISALNDMIFEDVDVSKWHENEIVELMVYLFMNFYKGTIDDIPFNFTEEDFESILKTPKGEEKVNAIKSGEWVPKVSINLSKDVDTIDIPEDFDPYVTITNKKTGFHVTFGFIKYGDQLIIRNWLDSYFSKEEDRFASLAKKLEYNRGLVNQFSSNPDVIDKLIPIDKNEEKEYQDYMIKKTQVITEVARLISIVDYNGQDVSDMSVGEKYELMSNDARIDYNMIVKLSKKQEKLQFGLDPEVRMKNPVTGEVVKRPLSFRVSTILQAMWIPRDDDYDDGSDDES